MDNGVAFVDWFIFKVYLCANELIDKVVSFQQETE